MSPTPVLHPRPRATRHTPRLRPLALVALLAVVLLYQTGAASGRAATTQQSATKPVVPGRTWDTRPPAAVGMQEGPLDELAALLGGRGCVVKDGYVVKSWGDQAQVADILSSAKAILSTLLFFAIEEGKVKNVDQHLTDFGWALSPKDRDMTFRHLGAMISGYARPEPPGAAYAYNDYAIQLYANTLFDRVFKQAPTAVVSDPKRLGALHLEDGIAFTPRRRMAASVRDFARIAWFWLNRGRWGDKQVLPARYFEEYMKPRASADLPISRPSQADDYLRIGTYGGGSEHFTRFGPGIYGFNWWFNGTGPLHPTAVTWPDAPADTVMSIGAGGNNSAIVPSLGVVLVCGRCAWTEFRAGDSSTVMNQALRLLTSAARGTPRN